MPGYGSRGAIALVAMAALAGCGAPARPRSAVEAWSDKVEAVVKPYVDYPVARHAPRRPAEFMVWLAPHGVITDKVMVRSSGDAEWDMTASIALKRAFRLPVQVDGSAPYEVLVVMAPGYLVARATDRRRPQARAANGPDWAEKVAMAIRAHLVLPDVEAIEGNPGAEFELRLEPDGKIGAVVLTTSSGNAAWDAAALAALRSTGGLPRDVAGVVPDSVLIVLRPKRQ